jgi:hypothetical protein
MVSVMRLIFILLSLWLVVLLSGCIQPESSPQVKEKVVTEEWKPDGVVGSNEYSNSMVLHGTKSQGYSGGNLDVSWKDNDEYLYMALNGSTNGWISVGFEPSEWMKDADIIMGSVVDGKPVVLDEYSTGNYGPHVNDTELGGTNDILEFGGIQKDGFTAIEFKRKLNTGDKFDKAFIPSQNISMIWAMANSEDDQIKHDVAKGEAILSLQTGIAEKPLSIAALSVEEAEGILFIFEEEKVARDVYTSLFRANQMTIFDNTAQSEQSHMDSVKPLIEKYNLELPETEPGIFSNQSLQKLHDKLFQNGLKSPNEALISGATYEEMSILDLQRELGMTDKTDITTVYEGLLAGSRKHLRSFVKEMESRGTKYQPKLLTQENFNKILSA